MAQAQQGGFSQEEIAARGEEMLAQQEAAAGGAPKGERPRTAGRKPPKVASKVTTKQDEPGLSQGVAPPSLIADGVKEDDDDDMFEAPAQAKLIAVKAGDGEAHGKLVRDILAEKKEKEKEEARLKNKPRKKKRRR